MNSLRRFAPTLFALALCAVPLPTSAQGFTDSQRSGIEAIVRSYLIAHPEVLEEAMNELNKRQAAEEAAKHEAAIGQDADSIFNSPQAWCSATRTATSRLSSSS